MCPTLCDPMDCRMPGFPVHHKFPELTQTHVHQVSDAIQPHHPLLSSSPPVFSLSKHPEKQRNKEKNHSTLLMVVKWPSHVKLIATPRTAAHQAPLSPSSLRVCSNSCPLRCYLTISSLVTLFYSCLQSFPASGSFPISQFSHQLGKVLEFQLQHQSFQ